MVLTHSSLGTLYIIRLINVACLVLIRTKQKGVGQVGFRVLVLTCTRSKHTMEPSPYMHTGGENLLFSLMYLYWLSGHEKLLAYLGQEIRALHCCYALSLCFCSMMPGCSHFYDL